MLAAGVTALCVCGGSQTAWAHANLPSLSVWEWSERSAAVVYRLPILMLVQLVVGAGAESGTFGPQEQTRLRARAQRYVRWQVDLRHPLGPCPLQSPPRIIGEGRGYLNVAARYECPGPVQDGAEVHTRLFFDATTGHLHLARMKLDALGRPDEDVVFADTRRRWTLQGAPQGLSASHSRCSAGPGRIDLGVLLGGLALCVVGLRLVVGHATRRRDRRLAVHGLLGMVWLAGLVAALAWWPA